MKFSEAIKKYRKGIKVRRHDWPKEDYIVGYARKYYYENEGTHLMALHMVELFDFMEPVPTIAECDDTDDWEEFHT